MSPIPYHPWDWCIFLRLAQNYGKCMVNVCKCVGKYTIHGLFEHGGNDTTTMITVEKNTVYQGSMLQNLKCNFK